MKRFGYGVFLGGLLFVAVFSGGCTTTKIQTAEISGGKVRMPVRLALNDGPGITVRGGVYQNSGSEFRTNTGTHSLVDENGNYVVNAVEGETYFREPLRVNIYDFEGTNLLWRHGERGYAGEIELDRGYFAVYAGAQRDMATDMGLDMGFTNIMLGLSLKGMTDEEGVLGLRFDAGVMYHEKSYELVVLRRFPMENNTVHFLYQDGEGAYWDSFFGLTLNTVAADNFVNVFTSVSVVNQTLVDSPDLYVDYSDRSWNFNIGVFRNLLPGVRAILGVDLRMDGQTEFGYNSVIFQLESVN